MAAQKLFSDFPAKTSAIPGMVTPNITADVGTRMDPATERMMMQRQWDLQDRDWSLREQARRKKDAEAMAKWEEGEAEAKIRKAYEVMYAPTLQASWDQQQGQILGADPRRTEGYTGRGKIYQRRTPTGGLESGRWPYVERPDTNMPLDQYTQAMNQGYDMWRAIKLLGMDKEKFHGGMPAVSGARAKGFGPQGSGGGKVYG